MSLLLCSSGLWGCPPRPPGSDSQRTATSDGGAGRTPSNAGRDGGSDPCANMEAAQRDAVVARVGNTTLTLCDFARRMMGQSSYLRVRFTAPEQRRALLRAWVESELLAAEARTRGLDRDPSVQRAITARLARQLEQDVRSTVPAPTISDDEVRRYYEEHRSEYQAPEQVRASHLVVVDRATAERLLVDARAHAQDDAYWRSLVQRASLDEGTKEAGGDLRFFGREGDGRVPAEVAQAAFALRAAGDIAPQVIESRRGGPNGRPGFHIVRFVARRDALQRPFEEVQRTIHNRLFVERTEVAQNAALRALEQRLRQATNVTINEAQLAQIHLDAGTAEPTPAAMLPPLQTGSRTRDQ